MAESKEVLVKRSQRVAYMDTAAAEGPARFERMTGFTSMTNSKNPKEYSRQYVDESTERSDVVGYAPATEYSFDMYAGNPVHERIAKIHDGEKVADDAHVQVVTVDFYKTRKVTSVTQQRELTQLSRIRTEMEQTHWFTMDR